MDVNDPWFGRVVGGKYRVVDNLGRGGMASVYLAVQEGLGREVALKVMRSEYLLDEKLKLRFEHEARATAELSHPNLVTLLDYGVEDGVPFLILERLRGRTLRQELDLRGPLPWREALDVTRQCAAGLAVAHARQILHRDIKTPNVFLVDDDAGGRTVKLLDFGIAKLLGRDLAVATREGTVPGTVGVMAPERLMGVGDDARSDLYSLGIVLFETLTARAPFVAPSMTDMIDAHVNKPPPPPSSVVPGIPRAVDELTLSLLAKRADARPTAATLSLQIGALLKAQAEPPLEDTTPALDIVAARSAGGAGSAPVDAATAAMADTISLPVTQTHAPGSQPGARGPLAVLIVVALVIAAVIAAFELGSR